MNHNVTLDTARAVRSEVEAAIADIFAKHGLAKPTIKTNYGIALKLTVESTPESKGDNGVNMTSKEAIAYTQMGRLYDLPDNALGVKFRSNGNEFIFTGISTNRPKFPINGISVSDGRPYKFMQDAAKAITRAMEALAAA